MQIECIALIYIPLLPIFLFGTLACFSKNKNHAYFTIMGTTVLAGLESSIFFMFSPDKYSAVIQDALKVQVFSLGILAIFFMMLYFIIRPMMFVMVRAFERRYGLRSQTVTS